MHAFDPQVLDFGAVGYHNAGEPFCVALSAEPLEALIADARRGWRLYELALIERPGDVWDYVWVTPQSVPESLRDRFAAARAAAGSDKSQHPWPEGKLPFEVFDRMFQPAWAWDPEPLDEAWRGGWPAHYAISLYSVVRDALSGLAASDPLIAHELRQIRERAHPWDKLSRRDALARARDSFHAPKPDRHADGFYRELARLLRDPDLVSVACRGQGDWRMLRLLCGEQRRRMEATGHSAQHALFIGVSGEYDPAVTGWGCEVLWFSEGLSHGDLLIEDRPRGAPIKELVERHRRRPQVVLADSGEAEIDGYRRTAGDGWVRYDHLAPTTRRLRQELIAARWSGNTKPALAFADSGACVYPHERVLVVVGPDAHDTALVALSNTLAEWRGPLPVVVSDEARAASVELLRVAEGWTDVAHLRERLPWVDVALLLAPHADTVPMLAQWLGQQTDPWPPWIAGTPEVTGIAIDYCIEGDLSAALGSAVNQARAARPLRGPRA